MVQNSKLQIPVNQKLKTALKKKADQLGFSSSNEVVRVLIQNFINGNIDIQFTSSKPNTSLVDIETERNIVNSLKEIKEGQFDVINFDEEALEKILDS